MAKRKRPVRMREFAPVTEEIERSILIVRGQKVLLDEQLAAFYGVETKRLIEAVKRNIDRFPKDFMFRLDVDEWDILRSQFATSNLRSQTVISSSARHGGRRFVPYAFSEQGVAMLSSVLRSPRAVEVNIQIMRAFVRLRQLLSLHKELAARLRSSSSKWPSVIRSSMCSSRRSFDYWSNCFRRHRRRGSQSGFMPLRKRIGELAHHGMDYSA
jgi:hypothetical protein